MMAGTLRVRRSQGALSGLLLVLLGIWGALIPFVGPYFHYAYTPDRAWVVTSGRMLLDVLPGVVTLAGGIVVLISRLRPVAVLGAWLAALAGAWFAVGDLIAGRWAGLPGAGTPVGGSARGLLEQIGFFAGLGVVIVFVSALALGRFTVIAARDAAVGAAADDVTADKAVARRASARAGQQAATDTQPRLIAKVRPVLVLRGRRAAADARAADAKAANTQSADADTSELTAADATTGNTKVDATQGR